MPSMLFNVSLSSALQSSVRDFDDLRLFSEDSKHGEGLCVDTYLWELSRLRGVSSNGGRGRRWEGSLVIDGENGQCQPILSQNKRATQSSASRPIAKLARVITKVTISAQALVIGISGLMCKVVVLLPFRLLHMHLKQAEERQRRRNK